MDNGEILARDLCHRRGVDPDSMVDVDGLGTKRPLWMAWLPTAVGDVRHAADEAREARAKQLVDAYRDGWRDGAAAAIADTAQRGA